jgi:uncharacterized protein with HEPN domain
VTERDLVHLEYIRDSIQRIEEYTEGGSEDRFKRHPLVQDAVLRRLETLADASHKLPQALKDRHPEIRWHTVYAFRNVAAHAYTQIDLQRVWEIVCDHLPALGRAVVEELHGIERDETFPG